MSGEPRARLPADAGGVLARLVTGIDGLTQAHLPPWALVGGLAVMVHVAEAHRVTTDVDAVVDESGADAIPMLVAACGAARRPNGVRLADGTDVDLIGVDTWTPDALPDDEGERMFVLAHWWALHTAVTTEIAVHDRDRCVASATVSVATAAALVATKLQAAHNRRRAQARAATDVLDAYRLLLAHDRGGGIAVSLAEAPGDLAPWAARALEATFVRDGLRWARLVPGVRTEDLELVGSLCADRLRALL